MKSITITQSVQQPSNLQFSASVFASDCFHDAAALFWTDLIQCLWFYVPCQPPSFVDQCLDFGEERIRFFFRTSGAHIEAEKRHSSTAGSGAKET